MKRTITVKKEVEIKKVKISVEPRYVGDGEDDDMPTDFPLLQNGLWTAIVDVDTGAIENWPTGDIRSLHIKVCDAGSYSLYDETGSERVKFDGYVPNIVPGSYGDYIELNIDENGVITNWNPDADIEDFFE